MAVAHRQQSCRSGPAGNATACRAIGPAYWIDTVSEFRPRLVASGHLDDQLVDRFLAQCADPHWWTQTIAFTAVHARAPGGR